MSILVRNKPSVSALGGLKARALNVPTLGTIGNHNAVMRAKEPASLKWPRQAGSPARPAKSHSTGANSAECSRRRSFFISHATLSFQARRGARQLYRRQGKNLDSPAHC